jgi:ribokinase
LIAVFGSINIDHVIDVDRLPRSGETIIGSDYRTRVGGKGANQAIAASRCGARVAIYGAVGEDLGGQRAKDALQREGVTVESVATHEKCATGAAYIYVDKEGENQIVVVPGANSLARWEGPARAADLLVMQLEVPTVEVARAASLAKSNNLRVLLNTAPLTPLSDALLRNVDIVVGNELEILGDTDVSVYEAIETAARLGSRHHACVVVTLGKRGAICVTDDDRFWVQAAPIEIVDTVGAGDGFVGAFAAGVSADLDLRTSVIQAVSFGSAMCTVAGAEARPSEKALNRIAQSTILSDLT